LSLQKPKFDLEEVKGLAARFLNGEKTILFSAPRRSIEKVIEVFCCSFQEAQKIIANGLILLKSECFHRRILQWEDVFDEYGLEDFQGFNWYVKFLIIKKDSDCIEEVSFHPLEKNMVLQNGRILKGID
jgi:hypothetical protein